MTEISVSITSRAARAAALLTTVALLLLTALAAGAAASVPGAEPAPSISSDKGDYRPGELVTLTGHHWLPGETVHISVNDDAGRTWSRDVDVTADAGGALADSFSLPDWFVAEYSVRATTASGSLATTTFTDGNVSFALARADQAAPAASSWSVTWRDHKDSSACTGDSTTGTTHYVGNARADKEPSVGNGQSAKPVSVSPPSGYTFAYWSATENDTTPLSATEVCRAGPGSSTLYAHFRPAIQPAALSAQAASGTYGGTVTLSATLTSGGSGVSGKAVSFSLGGVSAGTATTGGDGTATLAGVALGGVAAGTYPTGVTASFGGDGGYSASSATSSLTVDPKTLTGGFSVGDKVYDGTRVAVVAGRSLDGVLEGDEVELEVSGAEFDTEHAGTGKTVTAQLSLGGEDAANYRLGSATATATADVTPKTVTGGFTAADKVYDGTTAAFVSGRSLDGVLAGDEVELEVTSAAFETKAAGPWKTVTAQLSLVGAGAGNYRLGSATATATADVAPKTVTGGFTAADKVYDGDRSAVVATRSLADVVDGDDAGLAVTGALFDGKDVGNDKTVTADLALEGADAANYQLSHAIGTTSADITPKTVTGSFTAADKVYDGTTAATITGRALAGVVADDVVVLTGGTATFGDAGVGQDKPVTGTGFALAGDGTDNYSLASSTLGATAAITYAPASASCAGAPGRTMLQPINPNGTSVFKQGSTVPAKFRVCDAHGNSIGTPGVVTSFKQIAVRSGLETVAVNEAVLSNTPDTEFRWSSSDQQWIFNVNTKSLASNRTYTYRIALADGTALDFQFGLK